MLLLLLMICTVIGVSSKIRWFQTIQHISMTQITKDTIKIQHSLRWTLLKSQRKMSKFLSGLLLED